MKNRATNNNGDRVPAFALRPIALGVMLACGGAAWANPTGPQVAAGAASFASKGPTLTVTNAPGTIINWQSFSIGGGEHTRFQQQSAASAVLNDSDSMLRADAVTSGDGGKVIVGRMT